MRQQQRTESITKRTGTAGQHVASYTLPPNFVLKLISSSRDEPPLPGMIDHGRNKRLNAKAKRLRLEAQVVREKQRHEGVEEKARLWKERASIYRRYLIHANC